MRIAFHSNQLGYRGTEVNLKHLATFNQTILNNESFIVAPAHCNIEGESVFKGFDISYINPRGDGYDRYCEEMNIDYFYSIKAGWMDYVVTSKTKQLNHFVYGKDWDFHGHRCAFISEFLVRQADKWSRDRGGNLPVTEEEWCVPFYVEKLDFTNEDFRKEFNISNDQIVLGFHGGRDSFNINWVINTLIDIVNKDKQFVFIFLGIDPFPLPDNSFYKNFIFFSPNPDTTFKNKFINTCDGMIHARQSGETFGLSIGEFSLLNKPVLTYNKFNSSRRVIENLDSDYDTAHIDYLGDNGWYYRSPAELEFLIRNFKKIEESKNIDYAGPYKKYNDPHYIMERFSKVFLSD